jgi:multiple sugar transport system substrate-binding protein
MDDSQNKPGGDFSAFSGSYPTDPGQAASPAPSGDNPFAPVQGGAAVAQAPAQTGSPFVTEVATQQAGDPAANPFAQVQPVAPPAAQPDVPAVASEFPPNQTAPSAFDTYAAGAVAPVPTADTFTTAAPVGNGAENPFTVGATPAQGASGDGGKGIKRVLAIILLLVAIAVLGFLAFTFVGKYLAGKQTKTLTYWGLWENETILTPLIDEYKKTHPNIDIVFQKQNIKQYRERLQAQIDRGEGPDIFRFHNTWVPMLKNELEPAGKTGMAATEFQTTFYPVATRDLVIANQVYGIPLEIDGLALYYNEDIFRAGGVTPPQSWEDFRNDALTLTVKDAGGKIITAGAAMGTTNNVDHFSDILAVMMLQNGADLKNPISSEAQQALSFYHVFAEKPNNIWDETLDNSTLAFANRKVAMIFAPSWEAFTIQNQNPQLKFGIIPIPQLVGTNVTWASYWAEGVSSKSKNKDDAWEFLKFLSTKASMQKLYSEEAKLRAFGEPYSRVDLATELSKDPLVSPFITQAPKAASFFLASNTFDNGINDRMIKYLADAVNSQSKGVSAAEALKTTAAGFTQVLNSFR